MVNLRKRRYVVNEDLKWHKLSGSIIDLDRLRSPMEALISIGGKTMVAHTISALRRLGVNEFYICRGWKGAVAAVVAPGGSNVGRIKDYDWGMKIVNDLSLNSGVFEFGNNWIEWLLWRDRFGEKYFKTLAQQTQKGEWVWCTCNWILETFLSLWVVDLEMRWCFWGTLGWAWWGCSFDTWSDVPRVPRVRGVSLRSGFRQGPACSRPRFFFGVFWSLLVLDLGTMHQHISEKILRFLKLWKNFPDYLELDSLTLNF